MNYVLKYHKSNNFEFHSLANHSYGSASAWIVFMASGLTHIHVTNNRNAHAVFIQLHFCLSLVSLATQLKPRLWVDLVSLAHVVKEIMGMCAMVLTLVVMIRKHIKDCRKRVVWYLCFNISILCCFHHILQQLIGEKVILTLILTYHSMKFQIT